MMPVVDVNAEVLRVLKLEGDSILQCAERLQSDVGKSSISSAVDHFQKALAQGGKLVVMGVGKSGKVGQKIAATLCSTGSLAVYLHPTEGLHGDLGLISPKDAVLALSYTGNTEELVRLMPSVKSLRVPVVGICGNPQSKLAQMSDVFIDASVAQEACPHNLAPTSSTTLALALGDALAMALMRVRGFDAQAFAQNHPGGSIGKKLNLKVADIMHSGADVPTLPPSASMDEVIIAATAKKLGAVLIVDQTKLLGIITDGDLRRALSHREKFFTMKASEVMTRAPVQIVETALAKEALDLMENRPSQISVLPVVDSQGRWKGIVRLHDLVRSF